MPTNVRPSLLELTAFTAIARHGSFRAAADELGLSPSTLSHMIRGLEDRLGLRLFNRTTRSVSPTEAGARLLHSLAPILGGLDQALAELQTLTGRPTGTLRLNGSEQAARCFVRRILPAFHARYPGVRVDLVTDGRPIDIVAEGFDAGLRLVEAVPQGMIAVALGGDERFVAVASPAYLAKRGTPRTPDDLVRHDCIRFRLPSGKLYRWELSRRGQELAVDIDGAITLDHMGVMAEAAAHGLGIAFVAEDFARAALQRGDLVMVLEDWTPAFRGHALYFPSRRLVPSALRALVDLVKELS
jgi:DNA-binding transcriptional LysR family regulator